MQLLKNRIAVVTGASRGIGRAAALALAQAGAHIIAVARNQKDLDELKHDILAFKGQCTTVSLDVTDYAGVQNLSHQLQERFGKIDILFGNAGLLGDITLIHQLSLSTWDNTFAVNVTANWYFVKAFDSLLRQSDAGRVIFMSSGAAYKCNPLWGIYSISKAALEALARTYAAETSTTTPIKVMLLSPGPIRTSMRAKAVPGEDPDTLKTPEDLAPHIVKLASPDWSETGKIYDFPAGGVVKTAGIPHV